MIVLTTPLAGGDGLHGRPLWRERRRGHVRTTRIATLDERRFRKLEPLTGEPAFTLLPADAD